MEDKARSSPPPGNGDKEKDDKAEVEVKNTSEAKAPPPTAEAKSSQKMFADDMAEVYKGFTCPITQEIMKDPVCTIDGHSYERKAIETWFERRITSPLTGALLGSRTIFPNHALRGSIEDWRKRTGCQADDYDQAALERSILSREEDIEQTFSSLSFSTTTKMQDLSGRTDVKQWLQLLGFSEEQTLQYAQGLNDAGYEDVEALM
jgi:hypothetical protein